MYDSRSGRLQCVSGTVSEICPKDGAEVVGVE